MTEKSKESRERILKAAAAAFAAKGYDAVSVGEIVQAAKLAKPALYYYYKDKEDLYKALIKEGFETRLAVIEKHLKTAGCWPERLHNFLIEILTLCRKERDLSLITFRMTIASDDEFPCRKWARQMGDKNFMLFCKFLEQGARQGFLRKDFPAETLTSLLHGQMIFNFLSREIHSCTIPVENEVKTIIKLFLEGAGTRAKK